MQSHHHPAARNLPLCQAVTIDALGRLVPRALVETLLCDLGLRTPRVRKLDLVLTVFLVIAMSLYTRESLGDVLAALVHALRLRWPTTYRVPTPAALVYRRRQLGARPLAALFHRVCRPLATANTRGAFLGPYRLMTLDGTTQDVPDSPANVRAFGRGQNDSGPTAYPKIQCVYLAEAGTHAVVDAGLWPIAVNETIGAHRLVRSLTPGMLVLWDRGLHSYALVKAVRQRGAHVLSRVPADVRLRACALLPDGSYLAWLAPGKNSPQRRDPPLLVRVIEYVLEHPQIPAHDRQYRLLTTVLDWRQLPAAELAEAYPQRWEAEILLDEMSVHQLLAHAPLRSRSPQGIVQELYGLLLAHYAVRAVMHEAAVAQDVDPDRLSFVQTLRTIRLYLPDLQHGGRRLRARRYRCMLEDVAAVQHPPRRDRYAPRLVKRRVHRYSLRSPARIAAFQRARVNTEARLI
ncbi:MAG: IS4 family transposase [Armatimonadota bacterium]